MALSQARLPTPITRRLRDAASSCPHPAAVYRAFGDAANFMQMTYDALALNKIAAAPIGTRDYFPHAAHETFTRECVLGWNVRTRPGLPQLAVALLKDKGIDPGNLPPEHEMPPQERAIVRAIQLVALRGEWNARGRINPYHNPTHTAHVAVMAHYLGDLNDQLVEGYGRFVEFTMREKLLILLAAFAHDIDHPGRPNPPHDKTRNERAAIAAVMPILRGAGMSARDIARVETMILTTSPNGPHSYLKSVAHAHSHRELFRHKPGTHDELAHMDGDRELVQMAAILSDADLFASAGTTIDGNRLMGRRLTRECRAAGMKVDFTTAQACDGFMRHIVGYGFASQAAIAGFSAAQRALVAANDAELKKAARPSPKP